MFSFFSSNSKAVDAMLNPKDGHLAKIGKFIGSQQFTEQERAEMISGMSTAIREFSLLTANQSTIRSTVTRDIAILWIKTQLGLVMCSFIASLHPDKQYFTNFWMIATSDVMMWGTFGVMTYFFGAYGWGQHIKKGGK